MRRWITLCLLLAAFWLANSGHFSVLVIGLGVVSVAIVLLVSIRMNVIDQESQPLHLFPHIFRYWFRLLTAIIKANIAVSIRIWRGVSSIRPTVLRFETSSHTNVGKTILANSITLTPGTVTVDVGDNHVIVHALSAPDLDELNELDRSINKLEE